MIKTQIKLKKSEVGSRKSEVQFCNGDLEQDLHTYRLSEAGDLNPPKFVKCLDQQHYQLLKSYTIVAHIRWEALRLNPQPLYKLMLLRLSVNLKYM
ncbi:hypothetical protein [Nostoc sp.]|uniref:hypothetical protein n=1 Tax=Nostoc sp. TaxID=1180 RepID=UPI002FFCD11F